MNHLFRRVVRLLAGMMAFVCAQAGAADVHTRTTISIPMGDAQNLAADLYEPTETTGPWPTVLIQTPYNKNLFSGVFLNPFAQNPLLKSQDYSFVVLDWRGFFASAGAAYSGDPSRGEDGYDAVEWISAQSWNTGKVGTWGASALGGVQLQTALQMPPHLTACVPMECNLWDTYREWFPGGVYFKNRNDFVVTYFMAGIETFRDHPTRDIFWTTYEGLAPSYAGITTPMYFQTGWYDHGAIATIREFHALRAVQGPASPTRLLIGPWSHSHMGESQQGELDFSAAQNEDTIEVLAFFDEYMRAMPPATPPPVVRYFQISEDAWIFASDWPPGGTVTRTLNLDDAGGLSEVLPPASSPGRTYTSDPLNPVPTLFGAILQEGGGNTQGPGDLAPLIGRADTTFFQTEVLTAPLRLAGDHTARIWISADKPDVDVAARLVDVLPTGETNFLADGMRRSSLRDDSYSAHQFLSPGVAVEVAVPIVPLAATIPAGHRLGLLIAPSNHDLWDVNPQDGNDYTDDPGAVPATANIKVWTDLAHQSRIDLSIYDSASAARGWMLYD